MNDACASSERKGDGVMEFSRYQQNEHKSFVYYLPFWNNNGIMNNLFRTSYEQRIA